MKAIMLSVLMALAVIPAYAQNASLQAETVDVPVEITNAEILIVLLGVFGGLTTAYNGYRKNKVEQGDQFKWDSGKFFDRVIMGVLTSVPLAIGAAADVITLNIFTIVLIYLASLGGSELIMEIRARNKKG